MGSSFRKIALIASFFVPLPALCWWETGHRTVARLAALHLTPAARTRVARILNVADTTDAVANALALISTWADETKNETNTAEWHYIDLTLQDDREDIPSRCRDNNCAPARIRLFAAQLSSHTKDPRWSDLDALRFLTHLVGDIHQPLHAISDADLGGNCETLNPQIGDAKNIHALWDGEIVNQMHQSDQELAADLQKAFLALDAEDKRSVASGNQDDWTWESHELAQKNIYYKLHIPLQPSIFPSKCTEAPAAITGFRADIDTLYVDNMKPVVRAQLTKGGLRLARLLNESL
jgi:hypothetical protein